MSDFAILLLCFIGFPLILISQFLYYKLSKRSRINSLRKLGFSVQENVDRKIRIYLSKIAPELMVRPYHAVGSVSTDGGILVWWAASYQKNNLNIDCWCFRRTIAYSGNADVKWFQVIHVSGLNRNHRASLIRESRQIIESDVDSDESENHLLLVYKRPLFDFHNTLTLLKKIKSYA